MTAILVRPAVRADREAWEPLWRGYNAFYGRDNFSTELSDLTWSRFFLAPERMHALLAEHDGAVVGLAHYLFHRSTTLATWTCYMQDLFTAESARRRGVGEALIAAVAEQARTSGAERLYWHTHETNVTGQRLYDRVAERSGFIMYRKPF